MREMGEILNLVLFFLIFIFKTNSDCIIRWAQVGLLSHKLQVNEMIPLFAGRSQHIPHLKNFNSNATGHPVKFSRFVVGNTYNK